MGNYPFNLKRLGKIMAGLKAKLRNMKRLKKGVSPVSWYGKKEEGKKCNSLSLGREKMRIKKNNPIFNLRGLPPIKPSPFMLMKEKKEITKPGVSFRSLSFLRNIRPLPQKRTSLKTRIIVPRSQIGGANIKEVGFVNRRNPMIKNPPVSQEGDYAPPRSLLTSRSGEEILKDFIYTLRRRLGC